MVVRKVSGFRELEIYRRSYAAAKAVYESVKKYPSYEIRNGIADQMRRASLSIPMNIAEGYAKKDSQADFRRFLRIALGSANEMQVLLDFSRDVGYLQSETHAKAIAEYEEICKMLSKFIQSITKSSKI